MVSITPERIGKYLVVEQIGRGGFGVVYRARDPFIKRDVAIKVCVANDEPSRKRFSREAQICGSLHHPNVVTIHDFAVDAHGTPYLVQEFLGGSDLAELMRGEAPLALDDKLRILRGVAEGLAYAHRMGVVHRDIKPSNVRVLEDERIKVMDFGIADRVGNLGEPPGLGLAEPPGLGASAGQPAGATQQGSHQNRPPPDNKGATEGTLAYLSPEQLRGQTIDSRADIFSYGVLAFELLTGRLPFPGDTASNQMYRTLHQPPTLDDNEIPTSLSHLIVNCLHKSPSGRPDDLEAVLEQLDAIRAELGFEAHDSDPALSTGDLKALERLATHAEQAVGERRYEEAELSLRLAREKLLAKDYRQRFGHVEGLLRTQQVSPGVSDAHAAALHTATMVTTPPPIASPAFVLTPTFPVRRRIEEAELLLLAGDVEGARLRVRGLQTDSDDTGRLAKLLRRIQDAGESAEILAASGRRASREAQPGQNPARTDLAGRDHHWGAALAILAVAAVGLTWLLVRTNGRAHEDTGRLPDPTTERGTAAAQAVPSDSLEKPATGNEVRETSAQQNSAAKTLTQETFVAIGNRANPVPLKNAAAPVAPAIRDVTEQTNPTRDRQLQRDAGNSTDSRVPATPGKQVENLNPVSPSGNPRPFEEPTVSSSIGPVSTPSASPVVGARTENDDPSTAKAVATPKDERNDNLAGSPAAAAPAIAETIEERQRQTMVRRALETYQAAWRSLDAESLNRIHPEGRLRQRDLRAYRAADFRYSQCSVEISGNSAEAICDSLERSLTAKNQPPVVERLRRVSFVLRGDRWLVADFGD